MLTNISDKFDNMTKGLTLAFKVSTAFGVTIVLYYCFSLSYYPKGLTLGDGIFFVALSLVFGFIYLAFTLMLVSAGALLSKPFKVLIWLFSIVNNIVLKVKGQPKKYIKIDFPSLSIDKLVFSIFGLLLVVSNFGDLTSAIRILSTVMLVAIMYETIFKNLEILTKIKYKKEKTARETNLQREISGKTPKLVVMLLITPLILGGVGDNVINTSMSLTKVKTDNVVIHVKAPYTTLLSEYGIKGEDSNFGKDYKMYKSANILFDYVGVNTILSVPINEDGKIHKIVSIPSKEIFVVR
ncbi:Uncharacterised protein [Vibrio mimicus]|uniref:hypothetical protein n=1 Tax=Vibrio mimicus TaxID=674 RepID=UPI0002BA67E3|nr:hypothetical protein [Vibrio mimicus]EMB48610.1 hypothetical protein D908_18186 [Vibrio mimicus CAIM 602]MBY7676745.1 hypothetical protein [Vibrio mimicus]MBY7728558.1 hypothetical protein [Vibrio mimicus]TXY30219.1 hypothetical protein FXE86_12120 [Vibrio mimicus]SUQ23589.1 Uncharacterised protein [Vibrio mimicus]